MRPFGDGLVRTFANGEKKAAFALEII